MSDEQSKGPSRPSSDLDDLKARLGLNIARRAPAVQPEPAPAPEPPLVLEPEPTVEMPPPVAVPPPPPPRPAPTLHPAYDPARYEMSEPEPPPPKSLWLRWGRTALYALIPALAGVMVGYLFGRGGARGRMLGKVKQEAAQVLALVNQTYQTVDQVSSIVDPAFARALKAGKDAGKPRAYLRRSVDWKVISALEAVKAPAQLDKIFEADYKRFTRSTAKLLVGYYVDFTRLLVLIRDQVERTKAARLQLAGEARAGKGVRRYGVISRSLPGLSRGEVIRVRGARMVKAPKGNTEMLVFDVVRRSDPSKPIAVPGAAVIRLEATGLFKDAGALLADHNRRNREVVKVLDRLLDLKPALTAALDRIAKMKL